MMFKTFAAVALVLGATVPASAEPWLDRAQPIDEEPTSATVEILRVSNAGEPGETPCVTQPVPGDVGTLINRPPLPRVPGGAQTYDASWTTSAAL